MRRPKGDCVMCSEDLCAVYRNSNRILVLKPALDSQRKNYRILLDGFAESQLVQTAHRAILNFPRIGLLVVAP